MKELPFKIEKKSQIDEWRAETFWTKEPETISWIEEYICDGEVVLDIGANIGIYSLYIASRYPNSPIYAIEPYYKNYDALCDNIVLNGFWYIKPYCIAISDSNRIDKFYVKSEMRGHSGSQVGQPMDENGREYQPEALYNIYVTTVDCFSLQNKHPHHIKIDVDGQERKIVDGMMRTLATTKLKSVLIEVNPYTNKEEIMEVFFDNGFTTDNKFNTQEKHSRHRRKAEGILAENIIFTRV